MKGKLLYQILMKANLLSWLRITITEESKGLEMCRIFKAWARFSYYPICLVDIYPVASKINKSLKTWLQIHTHPAEDVAAAWWAGEHRGVEDAEMSLFIITRQQRVTSAIGKETEVLAAFYYYNKKNYSHLRSALANLHHSWCFCTELLWWQFSGNRQPNL